MKVVNNFISLLKSVGVECFPTGSQVYGGATSSSDYDFCISLDFRKQVLDLLISKRCVYEAGGSKSVDDYYGKSVYVNFEGYLFNIISLNKEDFIKWKIVTELMKDFTRGIYGNGIVQSKEKRVELFEFFRTLV